MTPQHLQKKYKSLMSSTDNARRSGRATKGQHRGLEENEATPPPKKGGRGRKKQEPEPEAEDEEEENAIIRCICGATTEEDEDERKMICCEQCEAWQHNECMEVSENDEDLPEKYYCEQCKPSNHKGLLKKLKKGEKPWEERQLLREQEEEERRTKKGKGKRGRKPRASIAQTDVVETNGAAGHEEDTVMTEADAPESIPSAPEEVPQSPQVTGNKRKLETPTPVASDGAQSVSDRVRSSGVVADRAQEPASKLRKGSVPAATPKPPAPPNRRKSSNIGSKRDSNAAILQTELVDKIEHLHNGSRQKVAIALSKEFESSVRQARKDGAFSLPDGQTENEFGTKLALSVEYAMYLNYWGADGQPSEQYSDKFRGIKFNIKANTALRDRLLTGELTPNDLSKMSRDDMASKELQEKKAEMIKEAEKQHTLIQEDGPRIRRTHKGEEVVDHDTHLAETPDTTFSAPIRKRPSEMIDTVMKDSSPEDTGVAQSPEQIELPERLIDPLPETKKPLKVDTQASNAENNAPERKSSSTFNIEHVWSGVKPSDSEQSHRRQSRPIEPPTPALKQQNDAELDRLLKDEDQDDDEEYEPTDSAADPNAPVWHGKVSMPNIATFSGSGRHSAGSHNSSKIPWRQLLPAVLTIEGRIQPAKAGEYLCGLQYSNTSDLTIVSVTPDTNDQDRASFDRLFKYFTERDRYGVITRAPTSSVKDAYVTPLEVGADKKPEFIELLDDCKIEFPVRERMLLLSFVVKMSNSPSAAQQTPHPPEVASLNSPLTATGNQPTPLGGHAGFQNSPTPGLPYPPPPQQQQYSNYGASPPQIPPYPPPPYSAQQPAAPYNGPVGMDAARQALGDLVNAPVVAQLSDEAPNSGVPEWKVVRELMENVPACQTNYGMLKGMLTQRLQQ